MNFTRSTASVVCVAACVVAGIAVFALRPPELNETERLIVGDWYGYVTEPDGVRYAWHAKRRADRTCEILFKSFSNPWDVTPVEVGKWRVEGDRLVAHTWDADEEIGFRDQLEALLQTGRFVERGWIEEYEILELTPTVFVSRDDAGQEYRAIRVADDFTLPNEFPGPIEEERQPNQALQTTPVTRSEI
jgi:hypothetical protein